jgi:hypothetical protein
LTDVQTHRDVELQVFQVCEHLVGTEVDIACCLTTNPKKVSQPQPLSRHRHMHKLIHKLKHT